MTAPLAVALAAALAAVAPLPALPGREKVVHLTLDGRPVDRARVIAVSRGGVVYADVVELVRSFDGVLTFQGRAVVVSVRSNTATFTAGSRTMKMDASSLVLPGAPFVRSGEVFIPLEAFVTKVAGAKLKVDAAQTHADIVVDLGIG